MGGRARPRRRAGAGGPGPAPPPIAAPRDLVAWRLDADGEAFGLLEWPPCAGSIQGALTAAEAAVVKLAVAGRSNAQIARERGSSRRTVANQMASAFRKLGVRSRLQLCALAGRLDPATGSAPALAESPSAK